MGSERETTRPGRSVSAREDENLERAQELAAEVAEHNEDDETRREAIEQELASEGLSEEGERLGQHND